MSQTDSAPLLFRDGFASLWHEPVLLPAELCWRWCFGLSAWGLGLAAIGLFLNSLKVSSTDEFLLHTMQPHLLDKALRGILSGSASRFLLEQAVLLLGVTLLWSYAATVGRTATLRRLVAMFGSEEDEQPLEWAFFPIFTLQLLRAMWSLIALAVSAALLVYGMVMAANGRPLRAALMLSFGVGLTCLIGIVLNWYFAVAPLFCVRNQAGAMDALDQAVGLSSRHPGRLLLLAAGFFTLRIVWAATMFFAFLAPLNLAAGMGTRWMMLLMGILALVYLVGADMLHLARLGAYVSLVEGDSRPAPAVKPATTPYPNEVVGIEPLAGLA